MIAKLLFERPVLLFVLLAAVEAVILWVWWRRRTRGTLRAVWVGLGAMPLLMVISTSVVTPSEQIISICHELARAVEEAHVTEIDRRLHEDFEAVDLNRDAFVDGVERTLSRFHVKDARLYQLSVTFPQPEIGLVEFNASCFISAFDATGQRLLSRWRVTFQQSGRDWLVTTIEALPAPFSPIRDLRDCLR